jgi:hypothetical protein
MAKETELEAFLATKRFDEARELLQQQLAAGQLINPREDSLWSRLADRIAAAIQGESGIPATISFWEALRDFFIGTIEPAWGHTHKGHIYFRLGFAVARQHLARARVELETAYEEDIKLELSRGGSRTEVLERASNYSAYVALVILERIEDSDFASPTEKEQFVDRLFSPSFDAAIVGAAVRPELVEKALAVIVPNPGLPACQALYYELQRVDSLALPFATVWATGDVLESILLGVLYHGRGVTTIDTTDIRQVELGPLLKEAKNVPVFPSESVVSACDLVRIFRNRIHPGNEMRQKYKLTARAARTLKILFEHSLLEWRKAFP